MKYNPRKATLGKAYRGAAIHAFRSYRNGTDFRDRKGRHISLRRWAHLCEHGYGGRGGQRRYRVIEATWAAYQIKVSTIWTGIDMSIYGQGYVFETMVFGGFYNHDLQRHSSEREAREYHWAAVRAARTMDALGITERSA